MFILFDYLGTTLNAYGFFFPIVNKYREGKVKNKLRQCIDPETPYLSRSFLVATGYLLYNGQVNLNTVLTPPAQFRAMACASFNSYDFPRRSLPTAPVLAHNIHSKQTPIDCGRSYSRSKTISTSLQKV